MFKYFKMSFKKVIQSMNILKSHSKIHSKLNDSKKSFNKFIQKFKILKSH